MNAKSLSPEAQAIMAMTADTVGKDLLSALVTEIKLLPKPWQALSEAKQDDIIERLRARVETNVRMAVHLIAAQGRSTIVGDLESVAIKDGIKAVFKVSAGNESRHDLFDAVGKACLLVVADAGVHIGGMDEVKADPDQRDIEDEGGDASDSRDLVVAD